RCKLDQRLSHVSVSMLFLSTQIRTSLKSTLLPYTTLFRSTNQYDKVVPVKEYVARQANKLIFDGEKLKLKEGEILLSKTQLDQAQYESDLQNGLVVDEPQSQIMEVEF